MPSLEIFAMIVLPLLVVAISIGALFVQLLAERKVQKRVDQLTKLRLNLSARPKFGQKENVLLLSLRSARSLIMLTPRIPRRSSASAKLCFYRRSDDAAAIKRSRKTLFKPIPGSHLHSQRCRPLFGIPNKVLEKRGTG